MGRTKDLYLQMEEGISLPPKIEETMEEPEEVYVKSYKWRDEIFKRTEACWYRYYGNVIRESFLKDSNAKIHSVWNGKELLTVGDMVKIATIKGRIVEFYFSDAGILCFLTDGDYVEKVELGVKFKYMFKTADGVDKYAGDNVWFVHTRLYVIYNREVEGDCIYDTDMNGYFHDKSKAEQYLAEKLAEKRGIEVGTDLFIAGRYLGKVSKIAYAEDFSGKVELATSPTHSAALGAVVTLEELAEREELSVGTELSGDLIKAWLYKSANNVIVEKELDSKVESLCVHSGTAYAEISNGRHLQIEGFSAFRKEWEEESKVHKGDTLYKAYKTTNGWINADVERPLAWESGDWDGERTNFVLVYLKDGSMKIARAYIGSLSGSFCNWYTEDDYEVEGEVCYWMPLPAFP